MAKCKQLHAYEVIVGNVGVVYAGMNGFKAHVAFQEYKSLSMRGPILGTGRAVGESVTLFRDGEIVKHYAGTLRGSL